MLLSHPDKSLNEHLNECFKIGNIILDNKIINNSFVEKNKLIDYIKSILLYHDAGKATDFFQCKLIENIIINNITVPEIYKQYIDWFKEHKYDSINKILRDKPELSNHSLIGAILAYYQYQETLDRFILFEVIKRHHGNLKNFNNNEFFISNEYEQKNIKEQLEHFNLKYFDLIIKEHGLTIDDDILEKSSQLVFKGRNIANELQKLLSINDPNNYFLTLLLYSILLSSDKGSVMLERKDIIQNHTEINANIIDKYKNKCINKDKEIDSLREQAYNTINKNIDKYSDNNFFSITLPTGLGKTFSAYNAAFKLRNKIGNNFKIIYCLPFTSIIDQNAEVMKNIFEFNKISTNVITKHHHLSPYDTLKNEYQLSYSESEYITEGWENDVIITTFVQFFESLFTNKNKLIRKFHNLINSIIILDEIQSIPPRFYPVLEIIFAKMAEYFGTRFIFVTATQTIIMGGETNLIELSHDENNSPNYFFKDMSRVEINQKLFRDKIGYEETKNYISNDINLNTNNNSFLIILNTIKQAQDVHLSIVSSKHKYFLSSEILPILRREVLDNVKDSNNKILVSTQVVEAGVDLDFDIVYRDFAPLSSLNQSAGRCNRNGLINKGIVNIFNSNKSNIYDSTLLSITRNLLDEYEEIIEEKDLFELNNKYFEEIKLSIQNDSNISIKLYNSICKLQFEDIVKEFVLIKDLPIYYDVFIPFNNEAKRLWKEYIKIINENEGFERRQKIKEIQPLLLDYVTKFPKKHYHPNTDAIKNTIIYVDDWEDYYDLITGFKYNQTQENESRSICI